MLQTSHSMVPSVCCTTEHACNCTSIGLHLRRSAAAINYANWAWQDNTYTSAGEAGDQGSLSSWKNNIGIPILFLKSQASSPFEALNSVCLSRCQSDVIPPVQMRQRPTAFSRASTGDSDISSSCDMKQEPKFKPLQGNPAFL